MSKVTGLRPAKSRRSSTPSLSASARTRSSSRRYRWKCPSPTSRSRTSQPCSTMRRIARTSTSTPLTSRMAPTNRIWASRRCDPFGGSVNTDPSTPSGITRSQAKEPFVPGVVKGSCGRRASARSASAAYSAAQAPVAQWIEQRFPTPRCPPGTDPVDPWRARLCPGAVSGAFAEPSDGPEPSTPRRHGSAYHSVHPVVVPTEDDTRREAQRQGWPQPERRQRANRACVIYGADRSASHHPFGPAGCGCLRTRTSIHGTSIWSVEPTADSALNLDRVCAWQEEMQHAVGRRESLPPAACGATARLLERFLEEEAADDGRVDEVRAAIALLIVASQRNSSLRRRPEPPRSATRLAPPVVRQTFVRTADQTDLQVEASSCTHTRQRSCEAASARSS
jgi:hypothetical protein